MNEQEKEHNPSIDLENAIQGLCKENVQKRILLPEFSSTFLSPRSIEVLNSMLNGVIGSHLSTSHMVFLKSVLENRFKPEIQRQVVSIINQGVDILDEESQYRGRMTDPKYQIILRSFREKTDTLKEIFPQGWLLKNGTFITCDWGGHSGERSELKQIDKETSLPFRLGKPSSLPIKQCSKEQKEFISTYLQRVSSKPSAIENQWFEKEEF